MSNVMEKKFVVGDRAYVVRYAGQCFQFYVDTVRSKDRNLYKMSAFEKGFGDDPPDKLFDGVPARDVFRVRSEVMDFVHKALNRFNPNRFMFSANSDHKFSVYLRIAKKLAKEYGYYLNVYGRLFEFYKIHND